MASSATGRGRWRHRSSSDVRIYNVVPTSGAATVRGEVIWNGTINVKINLVWFG
jgi:hypothetical protein